ncbi:hypothetical protein B9479_005293 [Cryptococcus floricola]|uniref:UNC-45/Cro1/She4 central domain-containing protein n=1 Tax=Cryptococcus floricola TaxID=2591691 RepID=A0A5D3AUW7_9TREE|nr:hypothetical protein B9479_005293 [Cryptococcus floricola]
MSRMEPAESQQSLVSRLGSLLAQLTSQREPDAKTETELVSLLDEIATVLKDESHRASLGTTKLPDTICALLNLLSTSSNIVNPDAALKEVGRVAANLVVQNDPNRNMMCALGYIDTVLSSATLGRGPRPCDHALVASLYNLVVEGNVGGENGTGDGSDEDEELNPEQSMGDSKAYLAHGIVSVSGEMSDVADATAFWARLGRWLASDVEKRKDLVECALLGMGNSVKDDASAHIILSGDIVPFDCIMKMLRPETPATTQHALVGLLRNLSISVEGQKLLSTLDVGDKLVDMGVWDERRDMLGSVQGGAIGIFKNLCKGQPATASHLIVCYKDQLLALLDRTNDQAIKFEGIRVFVNAARNLPKGLDLAGKQALQDQRIPRLMVYMLSNAYEHPILQGEAILGLALLAVFGSAKAEVSEAMNETSPESPGKTGEQHLRDILLSSKDSLSEEIRQNGETLVSLLLGQQKVE